MALAPVRRRCTCGPGLRGPDPTADRHAPGAKPPAPARRPGLEFEPASRRYSLYPLNPNKVALGVGSTGDTVRYLQGVCVNEVSRFAAWFGAHEPDRLPGGGGNVRKLFLHAAAKECATMAIDGHYDESVARAITFVQHAFTDSSFGGRRIGRLAPDGRVGRRQTWPFIDTLANGEWAA